MEMFNRLFLMIFKNEIFPICFILFGVHGCTEEPVVIEKGNIRGKVEAYDKQNNGFKITLEDASDPSIQHTAITDAKGQFNFQDIDAGTYTINAEKKGYSWVLMVDDGKPNHTNRKIELMGGKTKEITISMRTEQSYGSSDYELDITDINGNPIRGRVKIPKYSTTVAFRLYNGTDKAHYWSVLYTNDCFVSDDIGAYLEYVFESFSPTSGTLESGQDVVLIGKINQDIWSIYKNSPHSVYNTLSFWIGKTKEVTLDIEF